MEIVFSIIIPTCDRVDLLSNCLDLLAPEIQSTNDNIPYELIVTDDSINTETKKLIEEKYTWAIWVKGPRKGPAGNRNNGASFAKGNWLLFIDDDCLPERSILFEYTKAIQENPSIQAYEGRIYVNEPKHSFIQESPLNNTGGYFWSCNICINSQLFRDLNGFDDQFPFAAMEDVDFFRRLKQVTDKHMFLYKAAVIHPWRENKKLISATLKRHESQLYYLRKHPEERKRLNSWIHFRYAIKNSVYILQNAWSFKGAGILPIIVCQFLQIYFGITTLLSKNNK